MANIPALQGILFGLMGWAATSLIVMNASRLTANDRRAMIVCGWMVWMIPAFGVLVYRGLISTDTAALYCGATTAAMALIAIVSAARPRIRP